jgi:large subunit ribosomal protein L10
MALVFSYEDEIAPAKIIAKFKKEFEKKLDFFGGILEGKFITESEMSELASLPSREELYAKVVGSINSPISGFVNALAGNIRNLVYTLSAIKDKK